MVREAGPCREVKEVLWPGPTAGKELLSVEMEVWRVQGEMQSSEEGRGKLGLVSEVLHFLWVVVVPALEE